MWTLSSEGQLGLNDSFTESRRSLPEEAALQALLLEAKEVISYMNSGAGRPQASVTLLFMAPLDLLSNPDQVMMCLAEM